MFQKILSWIKGVWQKMIGKNTIKKAMQVDIAISTPMAEAIQLWAKLYENKAPWLSKDVKSLNLPAAIAGEIARSTTIEMQVTIEGSARADYLAAQFEKTVMDKIRAEIEYGAAKGGMVFKPYISHNGLAVDFIQADQFFPVSFDTNGNLTSCIFVDQRKKGDNYYTRLEYHEMIESGCVIRNLAFRSTSSDMLGSQVSLGSVEEWGELEPEATITNIDKPLFAYFRYPLANNVDTSSPLGVSCYARAVDLIKDADIQWSNLLWEFESGQRALYVDVLAFGKDIDGKPKLPNKRLHRTLETGSAEGDLYEEWSPDLRETSILSGLDAILKKIEFSCGLAYGTLSDPNVEAKTATEIKTSKQRTYATLVDTQKALQDSLEHLLYAMNVWATLGSLAPGGIYEITFEFDDSVVVDRTAQFQQDLQLVSAGLMGKVEFRMRNFKETEEIAKTKISEIQTEQPSSFFDSV
jgi:A118 family predicted phage portal protein